MIIFFFFFFFFWGGGGGGCHKQTSTKKGYIWLVIDILCEVVEAAKNETNTRSVGAVHVINSAIVLYVLFDWNAKNIYVLSNQYFFVVDLAKYKVKVCFKSD